MSMAYKWFCISTKKLTGESIWRCISIFCNYWSTICFNLWH